MSASAHSGSPSPGVDVRKCPRPFQAVAGSSLRTDFVMAMQSKCDWSLSNFSAQSAESYNKMHLIVCYMSDASTLMGWCFGLSH